MSDLHFAPLDDAAIPNWRRLLHSLGSLGAWIEQRTAGHDPMALDELRDSVLARVRSSGARWNGRMLLVATGDLTTWGDDFSLCAARRFLDNLAGDAKIPSAVIYGNHDVWPAKPYQMHGFPLFSWVDLDQHRTALRDSANGHFPVNFVEDLSALVPGSCGVFSVNTIAHARIENSLAHGKVRRDRYWEQSAGLTKQLEQLDRLLPGYEIAVLLTHHPIHDPSLHRVSWLPPPAAAAPPRALVPKLLQNAKPFADTLNTSSGGAPAARLVLSGHTHSTFPEHGQLPAGPPNLSQAPHGDLSGNCVQLTAGSASQGSPAGLNSGSSSAGLRASSSSAKPPNQSWQIVSLLRDLDTDELLIQRSVLRRNGCNRSALGISVRETDGQGDPIVI